MLGERLPVHIDPIRFAETGRVLEGEIPLVGMKRLTDLLLDDGGDVSVKLEFSVDNEGLHVLHGRITSSLELICQRCLDGMVLEIDSDFHLAFVPEGKVEAEVPEHYEPFMLDGELIYLQDIIEDELILALPIVPKHSHQCIELDADADEQKVDEVLTSTEENPFAVLSSLKK